MIRPGFRRVRTGDLSAAHARSTAGRARSWHQEVDPLMPAWTLWLIPSAFTAVFAGTVGRELRRTRRLPTGDGPCPSEHRDAVPVEAVDGELVAWLCTDPECGGQLPKDWRISRPDPAEPPTSS